MFFHRWLQQQDERDDEVGEVARFLLGSRFRIFLESDNIERIGSELFSARVDKPTRMKVRRVHREWRRVLLARKYGEWPPKPRRLDAKVR